MPRLVMTVLVEDGQTPLWHDAAKFLNEQSGIINERDNPTAPGEIVIADWSIIGHQIQLVNLNVRERMGGNDFAKRIYEIAGPFERDDLSGASNNVRKIDSGVSRPCAHVQNAFASGNASPFPAIEHNWMPHGVLQAQPRHFFFVRPKNIIAVRSHVGIVALSRRDCHAIVTSSGHW